MPVRAEWQMRRAEEESALLSLGFLVQHSSLSSCKNINIQITIYKVKCIQLLLFVDFLLALLTCISVKVLGMKSQLAAAFPLNSRPSIDYF